MFRIIDPRKLQLGGYYGMIVKSDELSRKSLTNAKTDVWIKSFNTDLILNFLDLGINNNGRRQTPHTTRHS